MPYFYLTYIKDSYIKLHLKIVQEDELIFDKRLRLNT